MLMVRCPACGQNMTLVYERDVSKIYLCLNLLSQPKIHKDFERDHEQEVVMNGVEMQRRVKAGHTRVEIKFLSKAPDGAMRFPTVRRLI